jgi:hypothetical protein
MAKPSNQEEMDTIVINSLATALTDSLVRTGHIPATSESARFEFFPQLPPELRLKIWSLVPRPPIIVRFEYVLPRAPKTLVGIFLNRLLSRFTVRTGQLHVSSPIHPLLHSCSESRNFMSKYYTPAFSGILGHPVWFNYSTSILALHNVVPWWFEGFPAETIDSDLGPVQNLIVEDTELTSTIRHMTDRLKVFHDPRMLCLVIPNSLAPEFRLMWMSLIKTCWEMHCKDVKKESGRTMKRSLLVLFRSRRTGT